MDDYARAQPELTEKTIKVEVIDKNGKPKTVMMSELEAAQHHVDKLQAQFDEIYELDAQRLQRKIEANDLARQENVDELDSIARYDQQRGELAVAQRKAEVQDAGLLDESDPDMPQNVFESQLVSHSERMAVERDKFAIEQTAFTRFIQNNVKNGQDNNFDQVQELYGTMRKHADSGELDQNQKTRAELLDVLGSDPDYIKISTKVNEDAKNYTEETRFSAQ